MKKKWIIVVNISLFFFSAFNVPATGQDGSSVEEAIRLTNFGVDAAEKGLWKEASIRWQQALRVSPNFPSAHNNLAIVYEHFGRYELAKKHYERAMQITENDNRYIRSNNRMFNQFYAKHIQTLDVEKKRTKRFTRETKQGVDEKDLETISQTQRGPDIEKLKIVSDTSNKDLFVEPGAEVYRNVGSSEQVFIKHPRRETEMSGKYRRIYIAGFAPMGKDQENLNFETTEFLRSELRKNSSYELVSIDELNLPRDEEEFDRIIDDYEFWQRLGNKVGADLIIYGLVNFYAEPSDGYMPYEYMTSSGEYRTSRMYIRRTSFTIELDMFFHEAATGELVHQESFGQTIVYRGRLEATLQSFYDVMNRVLPRFMDMMVPREHDAIRFLLRG